MLRFLSGAEALRCLIELYVVNVS